MRIKIKKTIPIMMSSSLLQQNFGERVTGHGFLLWDVEKLSFIEYNVENPYLFYNMKISSLDDISNNTEIITNGS
jgi:hypothetical protein